MEKINKEFFNQSPEIVARALLGKFLIRKVNEKELVARIVETEAYFGPEDPASRARYHGDLRKTMEMKPGTILVFGVHNNWLFNLVTGNLGVVSAVLIRAVEPINFNQKGNGPGLLTKSLKIDKKFHKLSIFNNPKIKIINKKDNNFDIVESFRIGVSKDLDIKLRSYIKGNKFVSRV